MLLEGSSAGLFFFVQVKATREGYTNKEKRLRVYVPEAHVRGLASFPAPTYVVGVDDVTEAAFIVSANGEYLKGIASLSTAYPLNQINRRMLWEEVKAYWDRSLIQGMPKMDSVFPNGHRK